ncbi:MAG TPA: ammonium transporter [Polyangiaceae bacterium]|nr:ammonium transporter [Polyangiaceae bacterium]
MLKRWLLLIGTVLATASPAWAQEPSPAPAVASANAPATASAATSAAAAPSAEANSAPSAAASAVAPTTAAAPTAAAVPAAAPVAAMQAAPAPSAGPTPAEIEKRLLDLEAYVNNGARADATTSKVSGPGPGHNGWMMVCSALVLFMTLPGLALFYGGLVRQKNVLSVMAQCMGLAGMVTVLWWAFGYSLSFAPGGPMIGGTKFLFFNGVDAIPNTDYGAWVSHNVFSIFQLMFAIITPGLIVGAIAERMKYGSLMLFLLGWMLIVYFPLAHMVWGVDGMMNGVWNAKASIKAIDFAGGTVVHMSSGWSAITLAVILGKRKGFGHENFAPHSLVLTMIGTGMLWVGWYGFNAGSAVGADGIAANAFVTTTIAAGVAGASWPAVEWMTRGKPTVLGFCSGIVGGLVVITPGAGFVTPSAAVIIGVLAGVIPYFACTKLKAMLGYDDALDTFGVHGVGGTLGALLTGFFAKAEVNPNLNTNLSSVVGSTLWIEQLKAMAFTVVLSVVATCVLAFAVRAVLGLRPSVEDEETGLDLTDHGERGYHLGET